jgi:uncharacterized protein (UPF0305 family)
MKIEASIGEVADKYTILTIKKLLIYEKDKLENIEKEWKYVKGALERKHLEALTDPLTQELFNVNKKLWQVEDELRECERMKSFTEKFIGLAREVYQLNDVRAIIKKQINTKYGSELVEEKSYKEY